jgi:hypothetical protein
MESPNGDVLKSALVRQIARNTWHCSGMTAPKKRASTPDGTGKGYQTIPIVLSTPEPLPMY